MGSVPQNRSATNGFHRKSAHQSGGGERGSSRKRSPPETRAPSQPESTPRQRFAGNPHAKAAAEGVLLRRIAGERPSEQRIQRFEAGQARLVQRNGSAGKERRASRSSSRGSVSPGSHALGAWETHAAGVDNSTLRRIVGGTSEQRIQRFEAGQARFVQRKSLAGEERAEPAGACPAAAFRREAARWADDSTFRRIVGGAFEQRVQRFEAGQAQLVQRNGSAGKERRASRSSSRGSVSPGKRASGVGKFRAAGVDNSTLRRIVGGTSEQRIQRFEAGQARLVQRKSFAGKPRAGAAAEGVLLRRIAGERPSEQRVQRFEVGQARFAQRKKLAGKPCADLAGVRPAEWFCRGKERAEPAGACPAAAFRRGNTRRVRESFALRGWTILRSVESSGVRPSGGFSASKSVRRGSSSGRASPGKNEPSQPELIPR